MSNTNGRKSKPQWFGSAVTKATDGSSRIPYYPFPPELQTAIGSHLDKAIQRRQRALDAIRRATTEERYDSLWKEVWESPLSQEGRLAFDIHRYRLREAFQASCGAPDSMDLTMIHRQTDHPKWHLLRHLMEHRHEFQTVYDEFVRRVCCPKLAELWDCRGEIRYQCFPCIRIVQPGEFSIGPHADVAYGHHPWTTNFYALLTDLHPHQSSAALFLESKMEQGDWHPILGMHGHVTHFPGALNLHWTAENNTDRTRVSLDFRLIPGPLYYALADGGKEEVGQMDVFRGTEGYYSCCRYSAEPNKAGEQHWERIGDLRQPDARVGFPWTVSNWGKFLAKISS